MIEHRTVELLKPHGLAEGILSRGTRIGTCEFRADGEAFVLDYAALCDGRGHYIYAQQELVGDWAEELLAAGGDIRFGVRATAVEQREDGVVVSVVDAATGSSTTIDCEVVACCDGAASTLSGEADDVSVAYGFRWLTLIAAVPPSRHGTIYGLHRRGFAGQMHRSPTVSRFMLEVPVTDGFDDWPDDRIWAELQDRLAASGRPPLEPGEFLGHDILDHRVRVCDPMQRERVFLAGDAAHLITPCRRKGHEHRHPGCSGARDRPLRTLCRHEGRPAARALLGGAAAAHLAPPGVLEPDAQPLQCGRRSRRSPRQHGLLVRSTPRSPRPGRPRPTVLPVVRPRLRRRRRHVDYVVSSRARSRSRRWASAGDSAAASTSTVE